jgi:VIT1/CCC1 family predicted Fe2+/Mn2+ transporter
MEYAFVVGVIAALFCYSTGKLIEQQPAARIIQGVIALIAGAAVFLNAGFFR